MFLLAAATRLLSRRTVSLSTDACLNRRVKDTCHACVASCPKNALTLSIEGVPVLDEDGCNGCGRCVPACPASALGAPGLGLLPARADAGTTTVRCDKAPGFGVAVPCLASLKSETLATAAAANDVTMRAPGEDQCKACEHGGYDSLATLVQQSRQLVTAFGLAGAVTLEFDESVAAKKGALDRRHLIDRFRPGSHPMAPAPLERPPDMPDASESLPDARRRFLAAARVADPAPLDQAEALPGHFGRVVANPSAPACDGCEACTHVCPTNAVLMETSEDRQRLVFRAESCIACGMCDQACPHDVLRLDTVFSPAAVLAGEEHVVIVVERNMCEECGRQFPGVGRRCPGCRDSSWVLQSLESLEAERDAQKHTSLPAPLIW